MLTRQVFGGFLEDGTFVPEGVMRRMHLEHGDILSYTVSGTIGDKPRKEFTLVAKGPGIPLEGRIEFDYAIVKSKRGRLMTDELVGGSPIVIDGDEWELEPNAGDIESFKLQRGDIITVAMMASNPDKTLRVTWKHDLHGTHVVPSSSPAPGAKKTPHSSAPVEKPSFDNMECLNGKHIVVCGGPNRIDEYESFLSLYGATVEHVDERFANTESFVAAARRADCVVSVIMLSHEKIRVNKEVCKAENTPWITVPKAAKLTVARAAAEALGREKKEAA